FRLRTRSMSTDRARSTLIWLLTPRLHSTSSSPLPLAAKGRGPMPPSASLAATSAAAQPLVRSFSSASFTSPIPSSRSGGVAPAAEVRDPKSLALYGAPTKVSFLTLFCVRWTLASENVNDGQSTLCRESLLRQHRGDTA